MCRPVFDHDAELFDRIEREKGYDIVDCPEDCDCPECTYNRLHGIAEDMS